MKQLRNQHMLFMVMLILVVAALSYWMFEVRADDAYITYRYARNLIEGKGFVFNPGENVLGTTSPLHGLLLGVLGLIFSDLPVVANVIGFISIFILAVLMYLILSHLGRARAGLVSGLLVATTVWSYVFVPLETVLSAAMGWAIIYFYLKDNLRGVSVLGALALITRGDNALLLALIYLFHWLQNRQMLRLIKHALATMLIASPWLIFAYLTYGSIIPNSVATKSGWEGHLLTFVEQVWPKILRRLLMDSSWVSGVFVALAVVGLAYLVLDKVNRKLLVVPVWMVAYTMTYTALQIWLPFSWFYYPIVCGTLLLSGMGLDKLLQLLDQRILSPSWLKTALRWGVIGLLGLLLILQVAWMRSFALAMPQHVFLGARDNLYRAVALWLRENTSAVDTIATGEIGTIAYYSDRTVIDLLGLTAAQVGDHMKRNDYEWAIEFYRPDYIIVNDRRRDSSTGPLPWFARTAQDYRWLRSFDLAYYPYYIDVYQRLR